VQPGLQPVVEQHAFTGAEFIVFFVEWLLGKLGQFE